jgi:hypothetical protein
MRSLSRGVAKLVKASDFDSDMRRFESFFPCHSIKPPNDKTLSGFFVARKFHAILPLKQNGGIYPPLYIYQA